MMVTFSLGWAFFATPVRAATVADGHCAVWGALTELGAVEQTSLDELSGMAGSQTGALLWALNDSGGGAALFAMDRDGTDQGRALVSGADNVDWEDLAVGPCDSGCACLYIGDLGDQEGARQEVIVWRVPEPDLSEADEVSVEAEAIGLRYPDGAWDAEALLVDPISGAIYVVPKSEQVVSVYGLLAPVAGEASTMEVVGSLDLAALGAQDPRVTGGAVSPGGERVVLRTNEDVLLFTAPEGGGVAEALATEPAVLEAPEGSDGEAVAWTSDGLTIVLGGEGVGATLWGLSCVGFEEGDPVEAPTLCADEGKDGCGCASGGRSVGLGGLGLGGLAGALALSLRRRPSPRRPPGSRRR